MIDLYNGQITDILPSNLKESPEVQALSYAIMRACQKLQLESKKIGVYADINSLPEKILDVLAIELRTQFYDESFPLKIKQELIKNTLAWYSKAGTVAAIEEPIKAIFGSGEIEEWFNYGGLPYHFKVKLWNNDTSLESRKRFLEVLEKVKRKSIVLDAISYIFQYELQNQHDMSTRVIHSISLSPFNSYPLAHRNGKHKRDGTITRKGHSGIIPYQFPSSTYNKILLNNKSAFQPKSTFVVLCKNELDTKVSTKSTTTLENNNKASSRINTTVTLQNENTIGNIIMTTKALIRRNGKYKRNGTAYRDGLTAKYNA